MDLEKIEAPLYYELLQSKNTFKRGGFFVRIRKVYRDKSC